MARLTWQNVDNPNFSGVSDSYRTMSTLLGNATKAGSEVLDTFRGAQSEAADRAILQRTLGIQDPDAYNAALAAGTVVGADGSRASLETLRGLDNRVGTLLNRAVTGEALDRTKYDNDRLIEGNRVLDANADKINIARSLAASGRGQEAFAQLQQIPGLRADQYAGILGDQERSLAGALGRDVTSQNLTQQRWGFGNQVADDASTRAARARVAEIISNYATPEDARPALLEAVGRGEIPPDVLLQTVQGAAGFGYGNILAPVGVGGGAPGAPASAPIGSGGALPANGAAWAKASGLQTNESDNNYGASNDAVGSGGKKGHFGAIQFGQDRLQDAKNAGVIPKDMTPEQFRTSSPEFQDKVADWHFSDIDRQAKNAGLEQYYGKNIGGVTINRDSIRAMAHLGGMGGVRRFIASGGRDNPADANGTRLSDYGTRFGGQAMPSATESGVVTDMINQAVTERVAQNDAVGITPNYDALQTDKRSVNDVVSSLVGEGGPFPGSDRGELTRAVNRLIEKSGNRVNAAIAGEMIARSTQPNDNPFVRFGSMVTDLVGMPFGREVRTANQPGGVRIDDAAVYAALDDYTSGRASQRFAQNELGAARQAENVAADNAYKTALSQYQSAVLAAGADPRMVQAVPRYKAALDAAQARLAAVRGGTNGDGTLQPDFDRTQPTPPEAENEGWQSGPLGLWKIRPSTGASP